MDRHTHGQGRLLGTTLGKPGVQIEPHPLRVLYNFFVLNLLMEVIYIVTAVKQRLQEQRRKLLILYVK